MNYLALDQATHTGYAIFNSKHKLIKYGMYELRGEDFVDKALDMDLFLTKICKRYKINVIIHEKPFGGPPRSLIPLKTFESRIDRYCKLNKIPVTGYYPASWRSILGLSSTNKNLAKKAAIDYVDSTLHINFTNHDDISDAICIGLAYFKQLKTGIETPPNIVTKSKKKSKSKLTNINKRLIENSD